MCFGIYSRKVKVYVHKKTLHINDQNGLLCNQNLDATQVSFSRRRASSQPLPTAGVGAALGEDKLPRHVDAWVKTRATRLSRGKYNSQGRRLHDSVHTTLPEMTELQKRRLIHGWGEGRSCQRQQEAPHGRGSLLCYQCQKSGLLSLGEPGLKGAQDLCVISYNCTWIYNHLSI